MTKPKKTAARGYGWAHQKLRAQAKKTVDQGQAYCWRCGGWIPPGSPFDLGHDDQDRSVYRGPEHVGCNRATSGRKAGTARPPSANRRPRSRQCEICGTQYTSSTPEQRTCSRACGWELRRRNAPPKVKARRMHQRCCTECSREFTTSNARRVTCSAECGHARNNRMSLQRYHTDPAYRQATIERSRQRQSASRQSRDW